MEEEHKKELEKIMNDIRWGLTKLRSAKNHLENGIKELEKTEKNILEKLNKSVNENGE